METSKIAIKTSKGIEFLQLGDILYCIAQGRYTRIVTLDGKEFFLTRILKDLECCLPADDFFRTHKSYLINLNHIVKYYGNHETPITLANNVKVKLAKRRKQDFQQKIKELARTI